MPSVQCVEGDVGELVCALGEWDVCVSEVMVVFVVSVCVHIVCDAVVLSPC